MTDRFDSVTPEVQITGALIKDALLEAVRHRDRSDGRLVHLAERARGVATEVTDGAFAEALGSILLDLEGDWDAKCEVMVAAEQFVYKAGANCLSRRTHSLIAALRKLPPGQANVGDESAPPGVIAAFRAYLLALAQTAGVQTTIPDLDGESFLRRHQPLLWLELVTENLAPGGFVQKVRDLLREELLRPDELVRRLPMIVHHQKPAAAQEMLDEVCRHLCARARFEEAWDLIRRAEKLDSRGWQLPLGGWPVETVGAGSVEDHIRVLLFDRLRRANSDAVEVIEEFRVRMAPHLAFIHDDPEENEWTITERDEREREEDSRKRWRRHIFDELWKGPVRGEILATGIHPDFRYVDSTGTDWWQDLVWKVNMDENIPDDIFDLDCPPDVGKIGSRAALRDEPPYRPGTGLRITSNADRRGFFALGTGGERAA